MPNLFDKATPVAKPTKGKAKGKDKIELPIEGLLNYASISAMITSLDAVRTSLEVNIKAQIRTYFTNPELTKRPDNFRGLEGKASASCELRKRSTRSVLTTEEKEALEADEIPVEEVVRIPERFIINPAYASDKKLLNAVSKALEGVKGLPNDFLQLQPAEIDYVVSDDTLNAVYSTQGMLQKHFDKIGVLAIKPKLDGNFQLQEALVSLQQLVDTQEFTIVVEE